MAIDTDFLKSIGVEDADIVAKIAARSSEEEQGLVAKRDELLGKVTTYKDKLAQYDGIDLSEYQKMQQRLKELAEKDMSVEERLESAKREAAQEWEGKYSEAAERLQQMEAAEKGRFRNESIFRAVGDKGDADLILDVIASKNLVEVVDKDGKSMLKVRGLSGETELDSVEKLIDEMKASDKYSRLFNPSGLSGGGSRSSHSTQGGSDSTVFGAARMRQARGG